DLLRRPPLPRRRRRRPRAGAGARRCAPGPPRRDRARLRPRRAPLPVADAPAREGAGRRRRALGGTCARRARGAERMIGRLGAGIVVSLALVAPAGGATYAGTLTLRGLE